jgi:hypothetical protein
MLMNIYNLGAVLQTNKQTNITCLGSQLLHKKLTMTVNISCAFVDIHTSKIHVANVGCTYVANFFSLIVSKTSSTKSFLVGRQPLGTTCMLVGATKWIELSSLGQNFYSNIASSKIQHVIYAIF